MQDRIYLSGAFRNEIVQHFYRNELVHMARVAVMGRENAFKVAQTIGEGVFGEVIEGINVVKKIQQTETDKNDRPLKDVVIRRMVVEQ